MSPLIVGVDPGKTVGLAYALESNTRPFVGQCEFDDFGDWIEKALASHSEIIVACERFVITASTARKSSDAHWALEATGVARHYARRFGARFVQYPASQGKTFASNALLRECGWWYPGKDHGNDAMRQVVVACAEILKWPPPWVAT